MCTTTSPQRPAGWRRGLLCNTAGNENGSNFTILRRVNCPAACLYLTCEKTDIPLGIPAVCLDSGIAAAFVNKCWSGFTGVAASLGRGASKDCLPPPPPTMRDTASLTSCRAFLPCGLWRIEKQEFLYIQRKEQKYPR